MNIIDRYCSTPRKSDIQGFTLIELMIVVAIIAIILTLALPVYSDYMIRSKIAEALSLAAAAKTAIGTTCIEDPTIPVLTNDLSGYGFIGATEYVLNIDLTGPCSEPLISIQTRNTGATPDPILTITGEMTGGRVSFTCSTDGVFQHVPAECRNTP